MLNIFWLVLPELFFLVSCSMISGSENGKNPGIAKSSLSSKRSKSRKDLAFGSDYDTQDMSEQESVSETKPF